jgi:hypothetical protein
VNKILIQFSEEERNYTKFFFLNQEFSEKHTRFVQKLFLRQHNSSYLLIPMHRGRTVMYLDALIGDLTFTLA